jgi:hypothetical protein
MEVGDFRLETCGQDCEKIEEILMGFELEIDFGKV